MYRSSAFELLFVTVHIFLTPPIFFERETGGFEQTVEGCSITLEALLLQGGMGTSCQPCRALVKYF